MVLSQVPQPVRSGPCLGKLAVFKVAHDHGSSVLCLECLYKWWTQIFFEGDSSCEHQAGSVHVKCCQLRFSDLSVRV